MKKNIGMIKIIYLIVIMVLFTGSFRLFVWKRIVVLQMLTQELDIQKRLLRIKEANFTNFEKNKAVTDANNQDVTVLIDEYEVALAALNIGELMRRYDLSETSFKYDNRIDRMGSFSISIIQTRINCGIIGEYKAIMEFMKALSKERYAYYLVKLRMSSAGMTLNQISAGIELLLFSTATSMEEECETVETDSFKNYIEGYEYENPFYYDNY